MTKNLKNLQKDKHGVAVVEFAFIAPIFMLFIFGIVGFGFVFSAYSAVQQLAAEAARASVSGLSDSERAQIAQTYVANNVGAYGVLDPTQVSVTTTSQPPTFRVNVSYNMSNNIAFQLLSNVPNLSPSISRSAVVQNGGS